MKPVECQYETEVLAAVLQGRWPEHAEAPLRAHALGCRICSEVAAIATALERSQDRLRASAALPDAGVVWWRAQMRARREAVAAAGRPISAVQCVAFACAVGVLGACFGATSTWFQAVLTRFAASAAQFDAAALLAYAAGALDGRGALALGLVALILLVPTVVYVILARD